MKLFIVESPGKIKKIQAILGAGYKVVASFGHIRDLVDKGNKAHDEVVLSVGCDFAPRYVVPERSQSTVAQMRLSVNRASEVILATDLDREGEAIAWHLAQELHLRGQISRVTFDGISEEKINFALRNVRQIDLALVRAQEARRVLDRLVGFLLGSPVSGALAQHATVGRVQSPAVRIVVDRHQAIKAFKPVSHYSAVLEFQGGWRAQWVTPKDTLILDRAHAEQAAAIRQVSVQSFAETTARKTPPAPFTTSMLQQVAQVRLSLRPDATMRLAQALYEQGAISYMRTDSPNISDVVFEQIAQYAKSTGLPAAPKRRQFPAKDGAQEGHEAIYPLNINLEKAGENPEEQALYALIFSRTVASQLADAVFKRRTAILTSVSSDHTYRASGETLINAGWMIYAGKAEEPDAEPEEAANPVPELAQGMVCHALSGKLTAQITRAPKQFSESSLIAELERNGIGRPSTYAAIVRLIQDRGYVVLRSKWLEPTPDGIRLIDVLVRFFSIAQLEYTAAMESQLDQIARGTLQYAEVVGAFFKTLTQELCVFAEAFPHAAAAKVFQKSASPSTLAKRASPAFAKKGELLCPTCGKGKLILRNGQNGAFWGCATYPQCKATFADKQGKPAVSKPRLVVKKV